YYTVEEKSIRMGLMAIKGIGYETIKTIIEQRKESPFKNIFDFVLRVAVKRNALETLVLAGAFDETFPNRASLLASITPAIERAELFGGYGEGALFKDSLDMKPSYIEIDDFTVMQKLAAEKELLSTYISTHPLKEKRASLAAEGYQSIATVKRLNKGQYSNLVAYAQNVKKIRTRRGDSMAFVVLSDETDELESVVFSNVLRQISQILEEDELYRIEGRASERNGEKQLIVNKLERYSLEELEETLAKHVYIRIQEENHTKALATLKAIAKNYPGKTNVIIYDEKANESFKLSQKYALLCNENCLQQLNDHFGTKNVVLK